MTTKQFFNKIQNIKPQKMPKDVGVFIPIKLWNELEDRLEDFEMYNSKKFARKIAQARQDTKRYSSVQVKKILKIK